jgi:hypothetical protein
MEIGLYILVGLGVALFIASRIVWRTRTYSEQLAAFLAEHYCSLVSVDIPRFWETGPFPKVSVRFGAVHTEALGVSMTHFEHRIVTFTDKTGTQQALWVRLLVNMLTIQDIIWEPGNDLLPDAKGWPTKGSSLFSGGAPPEKD